MGWLNGRFATSTLEIETTVETSKTALKSHVLEHKWFYLIILLLLIFCAYLYISKSISDKHHAEELVNTRENYEQQLQVALDDHARRQLSLMMKTFVWAVRSSMLRNNLDEVDQYFIQLVQEEGIHEIVLANENGEILVATNKKHEGQLFSEHYPSDLLKPDDVVFDHQGQYYYVAAPVLSLNTRLGTLFVVYEEKKFRLEEKPAAQSAAADTLAN